MAEDHSSSNSSVAETFMHDFGLNFRLRNYTYCSN